MAKKPDIFVVERRERIPRPVGEVFAFFDQPSNLKRVFPEGLAVSLESHPADLRPGTLFRYRLRRWPLDLEWEVVVSRYQPPMSFTHVKSKGYFPRWQLAHEIVELDRDSELLLRLTYEVPAGIYASLTNSYVIREAMEELVTGELRAVCEALA